MGGQPNGLPQANKGSFVPAGQPSSIATQAETACRAGRSRHTGGSAVKTRRSRATL